MSLMVDATAPTYGLSIWSTSTDGKPSLRWAEGLQDEEIATAESVVTGANASTVTLASATLPGSEQLKV